MKTKTECIESIKNDMQEAWNKYSEIYNLSKIRMPEVIFVNSPRGNAGKAYLSTNKVEFNIAYAMAGEEFLTTIYHELAHIICYHIFPHAKQFHGPEFKSIMNSQGFKGDTYHTYNVKAAKEIARKKENKILLIDSISIDEM